MPAKDEQRLESGNKCCVYNKLFDVGDNNHCHITGKYRGSTHLKLAKKVLVIFHNLKGYDSHLIMQETCSKSKCLLNGLEKDMGFTANINLVFIDNMQFMNLVLIH